MNSHPRVLGRTIGFLCTIAASQASASPLSPEAPPSKPAPAASSQATPSWAQPETPDDPVADLELAARSFLNTLGHPNPDFRGVAALHERAVVTAVSRAGDPVAVVGEQARSFLLTVFNPDAATFRMAAPDVRVEGRYGLVTLRFSAQVPGKAAECMVFHAEGWRHGKVWEFLRITLASMPYLDTCELEEG